MITTTDRESPGLTRALGELAAAPGEIPAAALSAALVGVIDAIGTMLSARGEPVVEAAIALMSEGAAAGGSSSVLLGPRRLRSSDATWVNATAAHAFAMDDVAWGCHPSALLMPALLAEGEAMGASGEQVLRAYVVGCEIFAELSGREPDPLHRTGWQPTAMLGPVAVAGALASLHALSPEPAAHAMAIAASCTGGLVANFGTPTKALHAGRAASAGVQALRLAQAGMTASLDALERDNGLLRTLSPEGRVDTGPGLRRAAGEWRILSQGISLKRHPVCYSLHRVVDAAIDLGLDPRFDAEKVREIEVTLGATQAWMARFHLPQTPFEAKYSTEFAVASGLLAHAAGFAQLHEGFITSPPVRQLIGTCRLVLRDDRSRDDPVFCEADRVRVTMADGSVLDSGEVPHAKGHARRPLTQAERRDKFVECGRGAVDDPAALFERLSGFGCVANVRSLAA